MSTAESFLGHKALVESILPPTAKGRCSNALCRSSGKVVRDRVVCFQNPSSALLLFCAQCCRTFCSLELREVPVPVNQFNELPDNNVAKAIAMNRGELPFTYQCRRCGTFVGQGERTAIIVENKIIMVDD